MSSNKVKLSTIFDLRGIEFNKLINNKYTYLTKEKNKELPNFAEGGWFNWEIQNDYNSLIAKALLLNGSDLILPNRNS